MTGVYVIRPARPIDLPLLATIELTAARMLSDFACGGNSARTRSFAPRRDASPPACDVPRSTAMTSGPR